MTLPAESLGTLLPGFSDPVFDAQAVFRTALDAMSYPGRIHRIATVLTAPAPLDRATTSLALALFDYDTLIWLDSSLRTREPASYLRFHCGCPITAEIGKAKFAIISAPANMPRLDEFDIGEDRYPDRSATLIIAVPSLAEGPETQWTGPGINRSITTNIAGLPEDFWGQWADNRELYPQGIDIIFTSGDSIIGLPRSVNVEA